MQAGQDPQAVIVVADDEDDVRDLVVFRLERAGYRVVAAADGEEALRAVREHRPALCILDIMMPGLDGFEVTRRIRAEEDADRIPVLLLTASVQESAMGKGIEAGADDHMRKPFSPQDLLARVEDLLSRGAG